MLEFIARLCVFVVVAAALVSLGAHIVHADHRHAFLDSTAEACHFSDRKIGLLLTGATIAATLSFKECPVSMRGVALSAQTESESLSCFDPFRIALREGILHPKLGG